MILFLLCTIVFLFFSYIVYWLFKPFHAYKSEITGIKSVKLRFLCGILFVAEKIVLFLGKVFRVDPYALVNWLATNLVRHSTDSVTIEGVKVFRYESNISEKKKNDCIIFIHGGGFILPHIAPYHRMLKKLVKSNRNCTIFSIDYHLAPRHRYPKAHDECYDVTKYILSHTEELGINKDNVIICGDSAGGNLVACITLRLSEEDFQWMPKAQILINPWLQCIDFSLPSHENSKHFLPLITKEHLARFASAYLAGSTLKYSQAIVNYSQLSLPFAEKKKNCYKVNPDDTSQLIDEEIIEKLHSPHLFPLMKNRLPSNYPDAHILACEYDILYGEANLFHEQLVKEGKKSTFYSYTTVHAPYFLLALNIEEGYTMVKDISKIAYNIFNGDN